MGLYTRSGDKGVTTLFIVEGGQVKPLRVPKSHPLVEFLGSLDEANSFIGLARAFVGKGYEDLSEVLAWVQRLLFEAGFSVTSKKRIGDDVVLRIEELIDKYYGEPLRRFILPSGPPFVASLHVARSVLRRAERRLVEAKNKAGTEVELDPNLFKVINRLGDLLFAVALEALRRSGYEKEEV